MDPSTAPTSEIRDKLTESQRRWVIRQYAEWRPPAAIRDDLKDIWGIEMSRQAVRHYSPNSPEFPDCWREYFEMERAAYVEAERAHAAASRAFRVAALSRAIIAAEARGNFSLVGQLCEIAAREMGDAYTNRRESQVAMTAAVSVEAEDLLARAEGRDALAPVVADVPPVVQSK